jgi:RimJ/RimL family protein N-acetyltransferase
MPDSRGPRLQALHDDVVALRPVEPADAELTRNWHNDPAIRDQTLSFRFPVTSIMETRFIERAITGDGIDQCVAAVIDQADQAMCGMVYLRDIDWISRHAAFGLLIGRQDRARRGLGRHAMRLMLGHGFRVLNLHRTYLYVVSYNIPAKRLYETYGFTLEGTLRGHVALDGGFHDLLLMGLLRDEFETIESRSTQEGGR